MKNKLGELKETKTRLDIALRNYQRNHARWAKWLHWARKQSSFDDWAFEQAMRQSDLRADPRKVAKKYRHLEPEYKMNMGAIYFSERHTYHAELDQLRLRRGVLLHELWRERSDSGKWVYSLAEIASAYGVSEDAMYKLMKVNEWFFARRTPGQRVILEKHLKP